tara:strand:- start:2319 stop:2666 length:348 start_codon:yes stop_codon:yes gene_type:complete
MTKEEALTQEVLEHLKDLSKNLIIAENRHHELSLFREDNNARIVEMKDDIKELRLDFKEMHKDFDTIEKTLLEFKNEMKPIIEFKNKVQQQIIRYSSMAFVCLMAANVGMNQFGV